MASDSRTHPAFDNDARQAAGRVVDALSKWRNELAAANDRWLANALDQMSVAARTLGWPDSAVSGMREHLQGVSKMQAQIIDRFIDAWSGNLKSPPALKAVAPGVARLVARRFPARLLGATGDERHAVCADGLLGSGRRDVAAQLDVGHVALGGCSPHVAHQRRPRAVQAKALMAPAAQCSSGMIFSGSRDARSAAFVWRLGSLIFERGTSS